MSFPFLESIEGNAVLIGPKSFKALLNRIFPEFEYRTFEKKKGLKYFVNTNIDLKNADFYYNLPPSASSALLTYLLKPKKSISHSDFLRNIFFTKTVKRLNGHREDEYLQLINNIRKKRQKPSKEKSDYIVLNVNSEAASRRMPQDFWEKVIQGIDKKIYLIGVEKDKIRTQILAKKFSHVVDFAGKTDSNELVDLLNNALCTISNDSGPAHLSSYLDTPTIVFFGAGDPENTAPKKAIVIKEELYCSPCLKNICPYKTNECLKNISYEKTKVTSFCSLVFKFLKLMMFLFTSSSPSIRTLSIPFFLAS